LVAVLAVTAWGAFWLGTRAGTEQPAWTEYGSPATGPSDNPEIYVSVEPTSAPAGADVIVTVALHNSGAVRSESGRLWIDFRQAGQDQYAGVSHFPALAPGEWWVDEAWAAVPATASLGEGSFVVTVDAGDATSNSREVAFTVVEAPSETPSSPGPPDLVATDLSVDPTSAPAGSEVTVRLTIRNQGERTSEACSVTFVIQGPGMIDEYLQSNPVPTIDGGQSWKTSTSVTITSHRKVGEGSIIARIDQAGNLSESESGRANNTRSVDFTVTTPGGSGDGAVRLEPAVSPVLAAGDLYSLAVAADSTVWAWGDNEVGQLGDGTTTDRSTPVQVQGMADVVAIAGKQDHTIALRRDGTVWAWGHNYSGQLGDGTTTDRSTPVQVQGMADVVAIAGGRGHTTALRHDGTVWAWGWNWQGQLGDGTTTDRWTPVQVQGMADVVAIAGGSLNAMALRRDGTVWVWGSNDSGQIGDGTTTGRSTPVQVQGMAEVVGIAEGVDHTIALRRDGTVWAWGDNIEGQLGDGTTTDRSTPVQVQGMADVVAIDGGWYHTLALRRDGTVWAWGCNRWGQLGDGTTTDRSTPVQVQGLPDMGP
jgi:alpha-tubulin suppressor-like RCC1 family protein